MNLKKMERYLRVNLLGPGPRLMKKRIYRAAVKQNLRNTGLDRLSNYQYFGFPLSVSFDECSTPICLLKQFL